MKKLIAMCALVMTASFSAHAASSLEDTRYGLRNLNEALEVLKNPSASAEQNSEAISKLEVAKEKIGYVVTKLTPKQVKGSAFVVDHANNTCSAALSDAVRNCGAQYPNWKLIDYVGGTHTCAAFVNCYIQDK